MPMRCGPWSAITAKVRTTNKIALLVLLLCLPSSALSWEGVVLSVHDGDTLTVQHAETGARVKIRLHGIDAPELAGGTWPAQPWCKRSRDFLRELAPVGSHVDMLDKGRDRYGRTVAAVNLPDGRVAQEELLRAGMAWVFPWYCTDCRAWEALQAEAVEARRGLWSDKNPVPPWDWRKGKRNSPAGAGLS